ncbi:hypothetical protein NKT34_24455 [Paenibacillus polysaccharolyticus]|nr:hypothetical protein [Paenibacillus polysaccharolyticus]MCP1136459.1 hypothetical protein [Paenibacillus polysaccharolyticus]
MRSLFALMMVFTILLGGCQKMTESEKQALYQEAEKVVVQHFKEKFELDVVVTSKELLPEMAMSQIGLKGHVKDHDDQTFGISYDYKKKITKNLVISPELEEVIKAKGHDPYAK